METVKCGSYPLSIIAAHDRLEPGGALLMALQHGNELAKQGRLAKFLLITSEMYPMQGLEQLGQNLADSFLSRLEIIRVGKPFGLGSITSLYSPRLTLKLRRSLKQTDAPIVHLHKIHFAQLPILRALKGFRIFHTIHDFGILCPKTSAIKLGATEPCRLSAGLHCHDFCRIGVGASLFYTIRQRFNFSYLRSLHATLVSPSLALKNYIDTAAPTALPTKHCRNPLSTQPMIKAPDHLIGLKRRNYRSKIAKVIFAGSLSENKGAHLLPEIFAFIHKTLHENGFDSEYLIFGGGPLEASLKERMSSEAGHIKCRISSYIERDRLIDILTESTMVVVPSMGQENQSGALLEAAQAGCLVMTTPFGGNPENYLNSFGCLWSPPEVEGFISRVFASDENYSSAISAALAFASRQYRWEEHLRLLDDIYSL